MAKTSKSSGLIICLLLLVLLLYIQPSECRISGDSFGLIHRKLFLEMKQMGLKNGAPKLGNEEMPEDWELRRVPAGPDPLHHNGQDPKKPRTP
ncbi:protein CLAVATA 3 [Sesamum indicum]|uniref:Protein CLAVATA 3 n=1 Tax=Sesamum indicum TaxID=4182 RepID=A0A6I9U546_SESIN|nr:protein CLAVATA 3 [Sesamum indicum]